MRLGEIIRRWRLMAERTLPSVAAEIGISAETLRRFELGDVPSGPSLAKIITWALYVPASTNATALFVESSADAPKAVL